MALLPFPQRIDFFVSLVQWRKFCDSRKKKSLKIADAKLKKKNTKQYLGKAIGKMIQRSFELFEKDLDEE